MVWGWIVVGRGSFFSSQNQLFNLILAFFTMLVGLAMAGASSLHVRKGTAF